MIEAIIKHIQDRGFTVYVIPHVLLIRRRIKDEVVGIDWAISKWDLEQMPLEMLFDLADHRIDWLEQAIGERSKT